jgi:transcriptional regulator with XRE-family HTH domain
MDPAAALLHEARSRADLSVRALAALARVSPNTVMDIEKGRTDAGIGTLTKLLDAAGFELTGSLRRRATKPKVTMAGLAAGAGESPDWTQLRGAIDWLLEHPSELRAALRTRPAPTGQAHMDTLIAGIAEKLADDAKLPRPPWTKLVPPAPETWLPMGTPRMLERWRRSTPPQLRARNLVVDAESLWRHEAVRG